MSFLSFDSSMWARLVREAASPLRQGSELKAELEEVASSLDALSREKPTPRALAAYRSRVSAAAALLLRARSGEEMGTDEDRIVGHGRRGAARVLVPLLLGLAV